MLSFYLDTEDSICLAVVNAKQILPDTVREIHCNKESFTTSLPLPELFGA